MTQLQACTSCDGFVPPTSSVCPNCHSTRPKGLLVRACHALAGGAVAVTLMACYGAPAHYKLAEPQPPPSPEATHPSCSEPGSLDGDGDGFCAPADCDDGDGSRYPGAVETAGDDLDSDCDGVDMPASEPEDAESVGPEQAEREAQSASKDESDD